MELLAGRFFTDADGANSDRVAIVDDTLAARAWPGESALGKRVKVDPGSTGTPKLWATVVGVVRHVRHRSLVERLTEQVYFPLSQAPRNPVAYVVRAGGDPAALIPALRAAVGGVDARLPLYEEQPLPLKLKNAVTSRIKIMSQLDISERRLPQDGRIKLKIGKDREMDFRVSVLPTLFVVILGPAILQFMDNF